MPEYLEGQLSPLGEEESRPVEGRVEKPYLRLSDIEGDPRKEVVIIEWMDFMFSRTNLDGVLDALSSYVELGWIDQAVRDRLLTYGKSFFMGRKKFSAEIRVGDREYKVGEPQAAQEVGVRRLDVEDHLRSLSYILELSERIGEGVKEEVMKKAGLKRA